MRVAALAMALWGLATPAQSQAVLFPYGFRDEASAVAACPSLLGGEGIARAGRGALVYVVRPGQRPQLVFSEVVPLWAGTLPPVPPEARAIGPVTRDRAGGFMVPAFDRRSPLSGVKCWFRQMDGAFRLVTIEVMLESR